MMYEFQLLAGFYHCTITHCRHWLLLPARYRNFSHFFSLILTWYRKSMFIFALVFVNFCDSCVIGSAGTGDLLSRWFMS
jgi:hypothetical protein